MKKFIQKSTAFVLSAVLMCSLPGVSVAAEEGSVVQEELSGVDSEAVKEETTVKEEENGKENEVLEQEEGTEVAEEEADTEEESGIMLLDENVESYPLSASVFDDVKDSDWFCSDVTFTLNKGIMTGKGNNIFAPAENVCRADFAVVLYRMLGAPYVDYVQKFPDVSQSAYFASAVTWANQESVAVINGYTSGSKKGYFGPSNSITREDVATMLYRYAEYNGFDTSKVSELDAFPDASKVSEYAKTAIQWAVGVGIITGDQGRINPQGLSSRAVCATMLNRFYKLYMNGQIANVDFSASCDYVKANVANKDEGTFTIEVGAPKAAIGFDSIQTIVYSKADKSDKYVYTMNASGSNYQVTANIKNHMYNAGTYTVEAYAVIKNVRIFMASTTVNVEARQATVLLNKYVNDVYNTVGRDLNKCYWWVVNNLSYQTLPVHVTPPTGYTRCENYALYAFQQRRGNCYCYAAAFYYLAKGLGYNVQYIEGQVGMAAGGNGPHGWVSVELNGATYICDPEAQDEAHLSRYNFYMQPKYSTVLKYVWP